MRRIVVAPRALRDIEEILAHSEREFGAVARERYALLLRTAMLDVARDPLRAGAVVRPELGPEVRTYHAASSRKRVACGRRVARPRHLLVFRISRNGSIEIGRVLHDSMELARHVPDE